MRQAANWLSKIGLLLAAGFVLLPSAPAAAHPLGNVSVNLYERVEIGAQEILIHFVLDIAEFPALREMEFADTNDDEAVDAAEATAYLDGFWEYLQPNLQLTVDGQLLTLERRAQELTFPPGQGGLSLMRAVYQLAAAQPAPSPDEQLSATLVETAFQGVQGWHEMVVRPGAGVSLVESSVPQTDVTDELRVYPTEMLNEPLSVREAAFTYQIVESSATASPAPTASEEPSGTHQPQRPTDPMVALLGQRLDLQSSVLGLLLAAGLGAVHAVTPGHGKTLVAAYLVGTRAKISQGLWLGGTVAVTHTAGIFVLGIATLLFTELIIPEQIVAWLSVITGALIAGLGALYVWRSQQLRAQLMIPNPAVRSSRAASARKRQRTHGHLHPHDHVLQNHHYQEDAADITPHLKRRDVAILGIVGGLVPSGSALLLLLSAVALGEVAYGLLLVIAFGMGMAVVLITISSGIVLLRRTPLMAWERWRSPHLRSVATWLPTVSGLIVVALGLFLTFEALRNLPS